MWESFVSPRGTTVFFRVDGHCLENVIYGHMDGPIALRLMQEFDKVEKRHGMFIGFHHWLHAPNYDTDYRSHWMGWLSKKNGTLKETHFLTKSRLVKMGLAVANIAYSKIQFVVHSDEPSYVTARRAHMAFEPLPPPPASSGG